MSFLQPFVFDSFIFVREKCPENRPFMFGSPSLCLLPPKMIVKDGKRVCLVDFFVHNCSLISGYGFSIAVFFNDRQIATLTRHTAIFIEDLPELSSFSVQLLLLNPLNQQISEPSFNARKHTVKIAD